MSNSKIVVLYAEDSDDDAFLMRRAFAKLKFPGTLVVVPNGLEAKNYLSGAGPYADRSVHALPRLILLDIKMPHLSGLEVLQWLRNQIAFRETPALMLTSSSQPSDIVAAYQLGVNGYLVKPSNLELFTALVEDVTAICTASSPPAAGLRVRGALPMPAGHSATTSAASVR